MNDDEGEDVSGSSATRYPCMPSLVALQQMRNRLHLAYVGKKLMKWTAQATGRELRRLAWELTVTSNHFSEDMCDAYMLLARARYFYPNLNKMVLEHIGRMACVTIDVKTKSISGVKVLHLEILDNGVDPYQHLGIAKGGQAISEAKAAWRLMLRRVILILEQRTSCAQVDEAHKSATKRSNVLKRQIIPRIICTIDYIIHELEEIEREDVYRIKLIKQHKLKLAQTNLTQIETKEDTEYPICAKTSQDSQVHTISDSEEEEPLPRKQEIMEEEHDETEKQATLCEKCRIEASNEAYIPMSSQSSRMVDPLKLLTFGENSTQIKVEVLKKQLNDVILMSKMFLENGVSCMNVKHFLQACENVKARIEKICSDKVPTEIIDDQMKIKLDKLKTHLRKVIEITKEFKNDKFLSPSVDNFARICQEVDDKINIYMKKVESQPVTDVAKSHLYDLKSQIKDVVEFTEKYKEQGVLKPSVEKFLHSCEVVKSKIIDLCTKKTVDADESKLDQLKMLLNDLEVIATDVKKEGLNSPSLENFLTSCKEFKANLDDYKNKDKQPPTEGGLHKLVSQLDQTISLTKEAKKSGLISGSVDDFIKHCENTKTKIKLQEDNILKPEQPKVIDELKYSVDDVIKMVNKCQAEGIVTQSIENFIRSLELTKASVETNKKSTDSEFKIVHPSCGEACICDKIYDGSEKLRESSLLSCLIPPCDICQGIVKETSENVASSSCVEPTENPTEEWSEYVSPELSEDVSSLCGVCKWQRQEEKKNEEEIINKAKPSPEDNAMGYFENKIKIITKVTRTQNTDGTIREEKETITIRKMRYDPTETSCLDDDESDDTLLEKDVMKEKNDVTSEKNPVCCLRRSKSECCARMMNVTPKRQSISMTKFRFSKQNVITKVIIPRLKATIKFILSELEEKEREEVFRLKRFKQLKDKKKKTDKVEHICCCCLSMFASEEETVVESKCPVCQKVAKAKDQSDIKLNVVPCKSAITQGKENKKFLDHLMSHIDDVIDLTKQYKLDGIVPQSIDKFIKTCSQVKETIEDYANGSPLCDVCKKFLESSRVKLVSGSGSSKSLNIPCAPEKTSEEPACTESCYNLGPETDDKFGYFEKKFKEIVKVTRLQNEDGSVSEEKQVITIRTERRNPRKTGGSNNDNFIGPNSGRSGGKDYGSGTDYGGGTGFGSEKEPHCQRPSGGDGPRKTKSEHANHSRQMGEPKLRSCMSTSHPKSTMNKDATTNFDSSRCMSEKPSKVTLPPMQSADRMKRTCGPLLKISKSSSIDSEVCCPSKTASVCGSELESGPTSAASIQSCKPITCSESAQTCCKEVPVKKPSTSIGTCCLPTCGGENTCSDNKENKFKTTSTEALWRDVWTSTTDLEIAPSRAPSSKPSRATSKKPSPVTSSSSRESDESIGKKPKKEGNCCTIKIIAKPPKVCCIKKVKEPEKEVMLPGSMFETIKSIFLPPSRSNTSCKIEPKEPDIKNICQSCLSKLSSSVPSTTSQSSSRKMCQASLESQQPETKNCPSCGSQGNSSCGSASFKSMGIGSNASCSVGTPSTAHTCSKGSMPSLHSQKHSCCLEKKSNDSTDDEADTCCAMAQKNKFSKTICCSKKSSSVCCPAKSSAKASDKTSDSTSGSNVKNDATTSTKRSARFDVRPLLKHTCAKINLTCTCFSDPNLNRNKERKPFKRSQSFYEDDYYFFRW